MTLYSILGVAPSAPAHEVARAYEARVAQLRLEAATGAGPAERWAAEQALDRVAEAWEVLGDAEARAMYDRIAMPPPRTLHHPAAPGAGDPAPPPGPPVRPPPPDLRRPPQAGECQLCGSTPAVHVGLGSQTGMVVVHQRQDRTGTFCRSCGLANFRELTDHTLAAGWWGPISFLLNWATIANNLAARGRLGALAEPVANPEVRAPLARPLDPGRPVLRRNGIRVVGAVILAIAAFVVLVPSPERSDPPASPTIEERMPGWLTTVPALEPDAPAVQPGVQPEPTVPERGRTLASGTCVDLADDRASIVALVPCDGRAEAHVAANVPTDVPCPAVEQQRFIDGDRALCVEDGST